MAYYSLNDGHVRLLLDVAMEHLRHGECAQRLLSRPTTAKHSYGFQRS